MSRGPLAAFADPDSKEQIGREFESHEARLQEAAALQVRQLSLHVVQQEHQQYSPLYNFELNCEFLYRNKVTRRLKIASSQLH